MEFTSFLMDHNGVDHTEFSVYIREEEKFNGGNSKIDILLQNIL